MLKKGAQRERVLLQQRVRVCSRRGAIEAEVWISGRMRPGCVSMPMQLSALARGEDRPRGHPLIA